MAKNGFFKVRNSDYDVLSKSLTIIPLILSLTMYAMHRNDESKIYFAGFALNILFLEFRIFIPRSETSQSRRAIRNMHKANAIKVSTGINIHIYRNPRKTY